MGSEEASKPEISAGSGSTPLAAHQRVGGTHPSGGGRFEVEGSESRVEFEKDFRSGCALMADVCLV